MAPVVKFGQQVLNDLKFTAREKEVAVALQIEIALEQCSVRRVNQAHAYLLGGSPYSRILFRIVRRLMPSITAA